MPACGLILQQGEADDGLTFGREILLEQGMFDRGYWYWFDVGVLMAYSILLNFRTAVS